MRSKETLALVKAAQDYIEALESFDYHFAEFMNLAEVKLPDPEALDGKAYRHWKKAWDLHHETIPAAAKAWQHELLTGEKD